MKSASVPWRARIWGYGTSVGVACCRARIHGHGRSIGGGVGRRRVSIAPENRPTPIAGQINGEVDPAQLVTVEGNCRVARRQRASFTRWPLRGDGIDLVPDDCYRPFVDQGSQHARVRVRTATAQAACRYQRLLGSAVARRCTAGGKVDFGQGTLSIRSTAMTGYLWLKANGARFGGTIPAGRNPVAGRARRRGIGSGSATVARSPAPRSSLMLLPVSRPRTAKERSSCPVWVRS